MFKNFFIITIRIIWRDKAGMLINLAGFSTGVAAFLVLLAFVRHELSFDRFHEKADRIFRINIEYQTGEGEQKLATKSPNLLGPLLKKEIPQIEKYVRLYSTPRTPSAIVVGKERFETNKLFYADPEIFQVFSVDLISGNPDQALDEPDKILVSESVWNKYIKGNKAVEQQVIVNNIYKYKISGIFRDFPSASHIHPEWIVSGLGSPIYATQRWTPSVYYTYLLLDSTSSRELVEKSMKAIVEREIPGFLQSAGITFSLFPLEDIHLKSKADFELEPAGDIGQVYVFILIGIFIILIACVNYINLATSNSLKRGREVGIKKILGSFRHHLMLQFLAEAAIITLGAVVIAVIIVTVLTPVLQNLFGRPVNLDLFTDPLNIILVFIFWMVISLISGFYPAFLLSSTNLATVIKGNFRRSGKGVLIRKVLVILQFIISSSIIIGTFVVYRQLDYMQGKKLGFNKDKVLVINNIEPYGQLNYEKLKTGLQKVENIEDVSVAMGYPGRKLDGIIAVGEGRTGNENILVWTWEVDDQYLETLGLEIIAGRNFSPVENPVNETEFIINHTAALYLGWNPEQCIGKQLDFTIRKGKCVGVVKDFHFSSLRSRIEPLALYPGKNKQNCILIRLGEGKTETTIADIETAWNQVAPAIPFEYYFLDRELDALYKNEINTGRFFMVFAIIANIIACMGLFGLSTYETLARTKEIGIRKAFGSTGFGIFMLLIRKFSVQVMISYLAAIPVSFVLMKWWLLGFAYKVNIGLLVYILSGAIVFMVAFLTVAYHSLRASMRNPVLSLRYE